MQLKKGDIVTIKETNRNNTHPAGTKAVVILTCESESRPYYCKAVEGQTTYWYSLDELSIIN